MIDLKFTRPVLCLFIFCFSFQISIAQDREALEERRLELRKEINRINELRISNQKKQQSVLGQVEDLNQQIKSTEDLIKVTNQQANLLTREINTNTNKIGELRKELQELKEDYSKMIRRSYKSKSQQSRIMFLLSSENFLQAYKRLQYMKQYTEYRKQQGEQIKASTQELQQLNSMLLEQKEDKEKLIVENRKTRAELEKNRKSQQDLVAQIRKREGDFAAQIRKKQDEINEIDRAIDRMIRESIAKANAETGSSERDTYELTPAAKALAADFAKNKGKLPWPVRSGVVTMKFGKQPHPVVRSVMVNNNGVRIDTDQGGKARAVFTGTVSEVQAVKGANKAVMVRHGDYITIYNNLEKVFVKRGDQVLTEQEIGEIATSKTNGKTTLHFLLYKNNQKMDPAEWIFQM
ncbi:peptidoglycan DD-metalloendopeptidase family protein [Gramella sp. GC03-9]|uniref:Peptidoglycan DD-metalloendopeptidase family protein n=1 Tax=Christiangramia oceanisediminis TaxID=2920386 RepID=A0A9X2I9Q5_9FLAO|nr:peptidoglycan DD-metalloendopeptidase family protein [Gramella oceanisediminis]MCP9199343.1 peptidoglycan DD-metalloendopeptidase family protein [Gramella oceanisediminis]